MGKANKLKRSRRLNSAKLQQEQKTLACSELVPSSIELIRRAKKFGITARVNNSTTKYSELIKLFVHPIINAKDDDEIMKTKYAFGILVWNTAIMQEKSSDYYLQFKKNILSIIPNEPYFGLLFEEMLKKKQEAFNEYKNIIVDFEIRKRQGNYYDLSVVSTEF